MPKVDLKKSFSHLTLAKIKKPDIITNKQRHMRKEFYDLLDRKKKAERKQKEMLEKIEKEEASRLKEFKSHFE
jgi:hypothetical protein